MSHLNLNYFNEEKKILNYRLLRKKRKKLCYTEQSANSETYEKWICNNSMNKFKYFFNKKNITNLLAFLQIK